MEEKVEIVEKKVYKRDSKKHYQTFKEKHVFTIDCDVCGGTYNYYSKYTHVKSKKHTNCVKIMEKKSI
jgi:hypothetical protein